MFPGFARKSPAIAAPTGVPDAADSARMAGVVAKDVAAFEDLYRAYHPRLSRFIGLMARRPSVVEEAFNDTMLVVWKRAHTYNRQCKVSTWIYSIAYRTTLKALRQQDDPVDDLCSDLLPSDGAGPEEESSGRETRESLVKALGLLSAEHQSALVLTYFHDLPYAEIAQIVDCPVDTVKTRVFHGKRRLRALLTGELGDWL
jgi:RNA polymerase sigma-70 factor (ECF subfamily)